MRRFGRQLPLLLFLLPAVLQAQHPLTPPFLVNVPDGQMQFLPNVAASSQGDFAVTWLEEVPGSLYAVHARRFSAAGAPATGDLLVTGEAIFFQHAVAMREAGSFVVGFITESGLTVRIYGPDGALLRETLVSAIGKYPAVAARPDGTFIVVWDRTGMIYARVFSEDGLPLSPERTIAAADLAAPLQAAAGPDRGFVVVWSRVRAISSNPHLNNFTVFAQRLGPAGAPRGKTITVRAESANGASSPDVAEDAAGNFLVAWEEYLGGGMWGILGRRYTAAGAPLSGLLTLERTGDDVPRLAMDPAGNFVVTWMEHGTPGKVLAQRFTAGGAPFRPVFRADMPPPGVTWAPDVAGAANGSFVVVWAAGDGVYARLYRKR
ncbi:MAG TPA: hypothetical protein VFR03_10585 [Thermoanaerobaculia bacterium]|nr:hypothetical protein [Thermoanaerobaculia bacterium]